MRKVWTLKEMRHDHRDILNGCLLSIYPKNDDIWIKDVVYDNTLLIIPKTEFTENDDTLIIHAKDTDIEFINVETLIPSQKIITVKDVKVSVSSEESETSRPKELQIIKEKDFHKDIHYGDGYDGVKYTFNKKISYDEFLEFCKKKGHDLTRLEGAAWYEDHAQVYSGLMEENMFHTDCKKDLCDIWIYKWIRAYTD